MIIEKPDKQSLQYLGIIIIIAIVVCIGFFYYFSKEPKITVQEPTEKTMEEIMRELMMPQGEPIPLPEEIINDLISSEKKGKPIPLSEEIINDLIAPK